MAVADDERGRKRLVVDVSKRQYVKVMKQLNQGASPNADWKGLLPLRTAVLVGDVDMVALLCTQGADGYKEPTAMKTDDGQETEVTLGKCARTLAKEIARDAANPLQQEGQTMLQIMDDLEEAKRRVIALQSRLEEEVAGDLRTASRSTVVFVFCALAAAYVLFRHSTVDAEDREL